MQMIIPSLTLLATSDRFFTSRLKIEAIEKLSTEVERMKKGRKWLEKQLEKE